MIRVKGAIIYDGGERVEFAAGPPAFVAWEAYARRQGFPSMDGNNNATMTLYLAYAALGIREGFDVWLKSVENIETPDEDEAEAVPPTPAEALRG